MQRILNITIKTNCNVRHVLFKVKVFLESVNIFFPGIHPTSGWAIDPFGHSPTMAYLLGKMGLQNMLIQRIHYSIKKHLSQTKQLEFNWRQNWGMSA